MQFDSATRPRILLLILNGSGYCLNIDVETFGDSNVVS
jgi:hypothetical protein